MTIDKLKKKLKLFQFEIYKTPTIEHTSTEQSDEMKFRTKYYLLAEKVMQTLKIKKKKINENLISLRRDIGMPYHEYDALYDAKKVFNKYDEFLDKMAEDMFEMERSYKSELYIYNVRGDSKTLFCSKGNINNQNFVDKKKMKTGKISENSTKIRRSVSVKNLYDNNLGRKGAFNDDLSEDY